MKRLLSCSLSFVLALSLVPTPALAEALAEMGVTGQSATVEGSANPEVASASDETPVPEAVEGQGPERTSEATSDAASLGEKNASDSSTSDQGKSEGQPETSQAQQNVASVEGADDAKGAGDSEVSKDADAPKDGTVSTPGKEGVAQDADPVSPPLTAQDNDPTGEIYDIPGTRFVWVDQDAQIEYTCYVTNSKADGNGGIAVKYIYYVGNDNPEDGSLEVTIPSTIEGYNVVELGYMVSGGERLEINRAIGVINVPATVATVNRIDDFTGSLRAIVFDANAPVTEIPDGFLFRYGASGYSHLERVVLPNRVERIGKRAFAWNLDLASVNMPRNLKTIDDCAFAETHLASIDLPDGLETIGRGAFTSHASKEYGQDEHSGVITATSLVIPDSVTSIGDFAFASVYDQRYQGGDDYSFGDYPNPQTTSYETITLGSGLKHIGDYAFANSSATSIVLPTALEEMGEYAFAESPQLQSVSWSDPDTAKLGSIGAYAFTYSPNLRRVDLPVGIASIGEEAFCHCDSLRDAALPPGLVSLGKNAFSYCGSLETVSIPGSLEEFGSYAFKSCTSLDDLTLGEGLQTIGAHAFEGCTSLKSVTIPRSVSLIKAYAFGGWYWGYNYQSHHDEYGSGIEDLTILGGNVPLTIGPGAFTACHGLSGKTVVLPKRVSRLAGGAFLFVTDATIVIQNPNIELFDQGEGLFEGHDTLVHYWFGASFQSREDALVFSDDPIEDDDGYGVSMPDPWGSTDTVQITKYMPKYSGTVVRYPNTLTRDTSPTFWLYKQKVEEYKANPNGDGTRWPSFEAVEVEDEPGQEIDEPVKVDGAGRLEVITNGSSGIGANVCVFDAEGNLAASAQSQGRYALVTGLAPGNYTVAAFARNGYFSAVGSLDGFATLGVDSDDYAQATVTVEADKDASLEIIVPKMDTAAATGLVEKSSVAISQTQTYKGKSFFATVSFKMAAGKTASSLKVKLPKGLDVTSVSSAKHNYGTGGYDVGTRTLTVPLDPADSQNGRIYVGLVATETGMHAVSASVESGGTTVPIGDGTTTTRALSLDLPTIPVKNKSFSAGVHAAPNTEVTLQAANVTKNVTTNRNGYASVDFDLSEAGTTLGYTMVVATVDDNGTSLTESGVVEFDTTNTEVATLQDFTFVHAGQQYYIVRAGRTQRSSPYYTYIANGKDTNKYWSFKATYVSEKPLKIGGDASAVLQDVDCTLQVQMLDGSSRFHTLSLISSEKRSDAEGGGYLTTFGGTMYLDQAGDHVFPTSLVPCAFDVTLNLPPDAKAERTQGDIDELRRRCAGTFEPWRLDVRDRAKQENLAPYNQENMSAEDKWNTYGWDEDEGYSWVFFYEVKQEFWTYYQEHLPADKFSQLKSYADNLTSAAGKAGEAFDSLLGAEKPITECDDVPDWLATNVGYEKDVPYDAETLEADGWNVTNDGNAPSAPKGDGTPTKGLTGGEFAEPGSYATKVTKSSDGGVKSVEYRDSNGNKATIPVEKMNDYDWLKPDTADILNAAVPSGDMIAFLDGIDDQINRNMTPAEKAHLGESKLGKVGRGVGNTLQVASVAVNQRKRIQQSQELGKHYADAAEARGEVGNIEVHLNYLRMHNMVGTRCWKALIEERDWAIIVADGKATNRDWNLTELIRGEAFDILGATVGAMTGGTGAVATYSVDKLTGKAVADGMDDNNRVLKPALEMLNAAHLRRLKDCDEEEGKAPNVVPPVLDPSGIVYEAVPSNTLEGVTATVYEKVEGGISDAPWEATAYDQVNPQTTGTEGFFGWDVPQGEWQVKFTKDGYESTQTDVLQVPPPQTGLEVPMVSTAAPTVTSVTASTRTVEVAFSQYMAADSFDDVVLKIGGQTVSVSDLSWKDAVEHDGKHFSKVLVAKVPAGTKNGDQLSVKVSGAKNYARKALASEHNATVTVAARPARLVFNFEDTISLKAGTSRPTGVRVYDEDNQLMQGVRLSASLDNDMFAKVSGDVVTTDEEGVARLQLEAILPGISELTVHAEGTALSESIKLLTTGDSNMAARPTLQLVDETTNEVTTIGPGAPAENTVYISGPTRVYMTSATEDATIFYTLDGSCPCQNTSGRTSSYDNVLPLSGNETADFIIAAYKPGMDYSERLKLNVRLASQRQDLSDATVNISPTKATYTGSQIEPTVTSVTLGGKALVENTDYQVTYEGNVNPGQGTVIVTGIGGYTGEKRVSFTIEHAKADVPTVTNRTYNGTAQVGVAAGKGYTLSGTVKATNAGSYAATARLATGYAWPDGSTGEKKLSWKMSPAVISAASMTLGQTSYAYDGKAKVPGVTLKLGGRTLVAGNDYTVSYKDNVNPGTATVTITGKGNYAGTKSATFKIAAATPTPTPTPTPAPNPTPTPTPTPKPATVEMYRLYNPNSGEHFYTASAGERDVLSSIGWAYEGVGWVAPERSAEPVYRLYNAFAGDHHYTTSAGERDALVAVGWNDEGVGWFSDEAHGTPLYRQYNPYATVGTHNYTTSRDENDMLVSIGWNAEGIGWYGVA